MHRLGVGIKNQFKMVLVVVDHCKVSVVQKKTRNIHLFSISSVKLVNLRKESVATYEDAKSCSRTQLEMKYYVRSFKGERFSEELYFAS